MKTIQFFHSSFLKNAFHFLHFSKYSFISLNAQHQLTGISKFGERPHFSECARACTVLMLHCLTVAGRHLSPPSDVTVFPCVACMFVCVYVCDFLSASERRHCTGLHNQSKRTCNFWYSSRARLQDRTRSDKKCHCNVQQPSGHIACGTVLMHLIYIVLILFSVMFVKLGCIWHTTDAWMTWVLYFIASYPLPEKMPRIPTGRMALQIGIGYVDRPAPSAVSLLGTRGPLH